MFEHTLYRIPRAPGLQLLQRRGSGGGPARELTTSRLRLASGESAAYHSREEETVLVLLEGTADWEAGGERWSVARRVHHDWRARIYLAGVLAGDLSAPSGASEVW